MLKFYEQNATVGVVGLYHIMRSVEVEGIRYDDDTDGCGGKSHPLVASWFNTLVNQGRRHAARCYGFSCKKKDDKRKFDSRRRAQ